MSPIVFPVVLLTLVSPFMTAPLQVIIDGDNSSRVEFCEGENVTFVCTLPTRNSFHLWTVPDFLSGGEIVFLSSTEPVTRSPNGRFTLRGIETGTTLSVTVFPEFNNTTITCSDPFGLAETQTITTAIFDPPSPPSVMAVGNADFESFNITINPPDAMSSVCIQHYNLSVFEDGVYQYASVIMNPSPVYTVNGLNLCIRSYTFKVVPITKAGTVGTAVTVPGEVNLQGTSISGDPRVTVDSQTTTSLTLGINIDVSSCANIIVHAAIKTDETAFSSIVLSSSSSQARFVNLEPDSTYICTVSVLLPLLQVVYYKELNCSTEAVGVSGTATTNVISIVGLIIAVFALALFIIIAIFVVVMLFMLKKIKSLTLSPSHLATPSGTIAETSTDLTGSVAMYEEVSTGTRSEAKREGGGIMESNEAYGVLGH